MVWSILKGKTTASFTVPTVAEPGHPWTFSLEKQSILKPQSLQLYSKEICNHAGIGLILLINHDCHWLYVHCGVFLQYYDGDKLTHRTIVSFHLGVLFTRSLWNTVTDEQDVILKNSFDWLSGSGLAEVILQSVWMSASHFVVRWQREMRKLQNEQLLPKINQSLCLLRVSGMGLSWCLHYKWAFATEQSPCGPTASLRGGSVAAGGAALPAASAQTGVVVSSGGGRDGLTACLSSNRPGRDDSIIISGMK